MVFNSFTFVVFLLVLLPLYYSIGKASIQVWLLIIASLIFYGLEKHYMVWLLMISATVNLLASYAIAYFKHGQKAIAIGGVVFNIVFLCLFKYGADLWPYFKESPRVANFLAHLIIPMGMSFYTFESISLLVDVFKGRGKEGSVLVDPSFINHARNTYFFISFFPHLVSGPILKAHDFLPQIGVKKLADVPWEKCFKLLIIGFFLKMVVADNLKDFTASIEHPNFYGRSSYNLLLMPYGFLVQIFADFAGYSIIAVGLGLLFGYRLPDNFNFPFISASFREFWQRWNISLSSFLAEYLYIPLGGNRKGPIRTCINIMITMTIGGIWHGATFGFLLWGFCHGLALVIERVFKLDKLSEKSRGMKYVGRFIVFTFVAYAALLFRLAPASLPDYFNNILTNYSYESHLADDVFIVVYCLPVLAFHLIYQLRSTVYYDYIRRFEGVIYAVMLFLVITNGGSAAHFIYFQF